MDCFKNEQGNVEEIGVIGVLELILVSNKKLRL
jgi:hypothetical protein